jgi:hypothetical protein
MPPIPKATRTIDIVSPMEIARMSYKLEFMEQELEFIKKIILAGREKK